MATRPKWPADVLDTGYQAVWPWDIQASPMSSGADETTQAIVRTEFQKVQRGT